MSSEICAYLLVNAIFYGFSSLFMKFFVQDGVIVIKGAIPPSAFPCALSSFIVK